MEAQQAEKRFQDAEKFDIYKKSLHNSHISLKMSSTAVPGGAKSLQRRKATQERQAAAANQKPLSTRSAGAGGSSNIMLKLYTDEAQGFKVDPTVVLFLAVGFIFSVIALHVVAKITGKLTA